MGSSTENSAFQTTRNPWGPGERITRAAPRGGERRRRLASRMVAGRGLESDRAARSGQPGRLLRDRGVKSTSARVPLRPRRFRRPRSNQIGPLSVHVRTRPGSTRLAGQDPRDFDDGRPRMWRGPGGGLASGAVAGGRRSGSWAARATDVEGAGHQSRLDARWPDTSGARRALADAGGRTDARGSSIPRGDPPPCAIYSLVRGDAPRASSNLARSTGVPPTRPSRAARVRSLLSLYVRDSRTAGFGA
jgi:aspartyl-tRNA(Asn)/glutamyl-tRNA(Gln) amidotransferase subunit A